MSTRASTFLCKSGRVIAAELLSRDFSIGGSELIELFCSSIVETAAAFLYFLLFKKLWAAEIRSSKITSSCNGSNLFLLTDFLQQQFSCKCLDLLLTDLLVTGKLHSETFPSTLILRVLFSGSQILSLNN
jgi:hypothetical protein